MAKKSPKKPTRPRPRLRPRRVPPSTRSGRKSYVRAARSAGFGRIDRRAPLSCTFGARRVASALQNVGCLTLEAGGFHRARARSPGERTSRRPGRRRRAGVRQDLRTLGGRDLETAETDSLDGARWARGQEARGQEVARQGQEEPRARGVRTRFLCYTPAALRAGRQEGDAQEEPDPRPSRRRPPSPPPRPRHGGVRRRVRAPNRAPPVRNRQEVAREAGLEPSRRPRRRS